MIISHNLLAMNSNRMYGINTGIKAKSAEKLSSGYRINRAADDAAGLSISEKMRRQVRGLHQAKENIQDGISFCNVAEGALSEVSDMLIRISELSVKAANGTNTDKDRSYIDSEVQHIGQEIDRIFKTTTFNEREIWPPVLEPMVSGAANDYGMYSVKDSSGEYYGGITYMGHRYSWTDLGIDWDQSTHTFTENKTYTIDNSILKNDSSTTVDDYNSKESTAKFTISTTKGIDVAAVQKNYSWTADNQGIRIDGVLTEGADGSLEGNSTWDKMGITPGSEVPQGEYGFDYYGMHIFFEVGETLDWDDFTKAINDPPMQINWHSSSGATSSSSNVTNSSSGVSRIIINNTDRDNIANSYKVVADDDKIYVSSNASPTGADRAGYGKKSSETVWTDLGNSGPEGTGKYQIGSWGTDVNANEGSSKTDAINSGDSNDGSNYLSTREDATYSFSANSDYLTTDSGNLNFSFKIKDNQSKTEIIEDINSIYFDVKKTSSPTKVVANGNEKIHVLNSSSENISFYTQRDVMNRAYADNAETIDSAGKVDVDADGKFSITVGGYTMNSASVNLSIVSGEARRNAELAYSRMVDEYNSSIESERNRLWFDYSKNADSLYDDMDSLVYYTADTLATKELLDDDGNPVLDSDDNPVKYTVADEYVVSRLNYDVFTSFSDDEIKRLFGLTDDDFKKQVFDEYGNPVLDPDDNPVYRYLTIDERNALIESSWTGFSDYKKLTIFDDPAIDKNALVKLNNNNRIYYLSAWYEAQVRTFDRAQGTGDTFTSIDRILGEYEGSNDSLMAKKLDFYKVARDNELNTKMLDQRTMVFRGPINSDSISLTFDTSGVLLSDLINLQDDDEIKEKLSTMNTSSLNTTYRPEVMNSADVTDTIKSLFTTPTFSLNGNGESYQEVQFSQKTHNSGSKAINIPEVNVTKSGFFIQAGPEAGQHIDVLYDNMRLASLGIRGIHVDTVDGANTMLAAIKNAQQKVSAERSDFGAYTNRLEHAYNSNYNTEENTTAAESRIRDTDMALEMVKLSNHNVILQAGEAMMAQANQSNQGVLALLR